MEVIQIEELTKEYNHNKVLNGVDLKVEAGSIFGLLGKNGAGKSTLMNVITGLTFKTNGKYKLTVDLDKEVKKNIGVLPDYSSFYDNMTGLEHMQYFNMILHANRSKEELINLLKRIDLSNGINLKTKKYSFGMKKKLGIAQALINKPSILFLDEPTSGVDANSILTVHKVIKEVAQSGTTIFFTSHNLDEIQKLSDKIAIMDKGKVNISGSMATLRKNFNENIEVNIEVDNLTEEIFRKFKEEFSHLVKNISVIDKKLKITVDSKKHIPKINEFLVINKVAVFNLVINEPSLEEIFINSGGEN